MHISHEVLKVAPLAGARIEMLLIRLSSAAVVVAPLAGARIEIVVWIGYE